MAVILLLDIRKIINALTVGKATLRIEAVLRQLKMGFFGPFVVVFKP